MPTSGSRPTRSICAQRKALRHGQRGLSLIEMTVAVAIVATLAALATTSFAPSTGRARLEAEAREIASVLGDARTRAITSRVPVSIEVDPAKNRLVYGAPPIQRELPPGIRLRNRSRGEGVASSDRHRITFFPEGGASGGGVVVGDDRSAIMISVDWLTGRIVVGDLARAG
jgi:general secretion pathway protein H